MNATQADQPAEQAGAPPVPMTLRAIAAWLESHPAAAVHDINMILRDPFVVHGYLAGGDPLLYDQARRIGDGWHEEWRYRERGLEWPIAPGVVYRLKDAR